MDEKFIVPDGTTQIEKRAFCGNLKLTCAVIPDGVLSIGESAFESCANLKRIYIPDSVSNIEKDAFKSCPNLTIYCQGEVKAGWVDGEEEVEVEDYYTTAEDFAFDFHRGGVSRWSYTRKETRKVCWNPDNLKVVTNFPYSEFEKLN